MATILAPKDRQRKSFASFLPWAFEIDDGVIVCKDGGFQVSWDVNCADLDSLSEEFRDYVLETFVQAAGRLDSGWSLHFDYLREPLEPLSRDEFPDEVTQRIDDARVKRFNTLGVMYGAVLTLTLRWVPPAGTERKLAEKIKAFASRNKKSADVDPMFEERYGLFMDGVAKFEDGASDVLGLLRMVTARIPPTNISFSPAQAHLFQVVYGMGKTFSSHDTYDGMYLDSKLAVADLHAGLTPYLDGQYLAIMGIDDFPSQTATGMFNELAGLGMEYRWSTRFILLTEAESTKEMAMHRRKWAQSASSFIDQYMGTKKDDHKARVAQERIDDTDEAMIEASMGDLRYGYYTSAFVFRSPDKKRLLRSMRQIRAALAKSGCVGRIERENATEAFLGSLPGETKMNIRRPLLHTVHLANILPLTNPWSGSSLCPSPLIDDGGARSLMRCAAGGCTAFDLNLHEGDVGHTLIFGATGSGKSVLLGMLAAQWRRYEGARVVCFDKGQSLRTLTEGVDGVWRELGFDAGSGFKPLETLAGDSDELSHGEKAWVAEWISDIVRLNGVEPTPAQRQSISNAVGMVGMPGVGRSMMDLQAAIQDPAIKEVLNRYSGEGDFARMYDDTSDDHHDFGADFLCYEMEELQTLSQEAVIPLLLFIFRTIENAASGAPTLILLDEAWALLAHKVFAEKVREWLKTMRKKNTAVVMATQSLADAVKSGLLDVLVESCPTKIYGANPEAEGPSAENYKKLGLTGADIHVIAHLTRKRQYYVTGGDGQRRVIDMALGPEELSWVGVSDPASIKEVLSIKASNPDDWRSRWELRQQSEESAA